MHGSAGKYAGYRLRRGTLILSGGAALGLGSAMIAGTIVCLGTVAAPWAVGMRRGTIVLIQHEPMELHVGFTQPEPVQLSYLPILLADLRRYLLPNEAELFNSSLFHRALGDRSVGGMGEILLIPQPADESP